jgi:phage anti-repressor protein
MNFEEFSDFLKKYSTIPNTFIDDFFSFYKYNTSDEEIIIDINLVAKWLKMNKSDLKKTLIRSYIENIDYKISIEKSLNKTGRPSEMILISTSCFKRISMNSNTEKGGEVREYYEKIEKLLHKYKDHIIDGLNKKIGILENNQKPKIDSKKSLIYFIRSHLTADNVFKLGKSKKIKKRLLSHNSSHADDLEVVLVFETMNMTEVESCLKGVLKKKQYRKRKEIYQIDLDTLKEVLEGCDKLVRKANRKKTKKEIAESRIKDNKEYNYFLYLDKGEDDNIMI